MPSSCNDYLDVDAPSAYTPAFVFSQKTEIERSLNGVYAQLLTNDLYGDAYLSKFTLNSDVDVSISSASAHSHNTYSRFDCDAQGSDINKYWTAAYNAIEYANKFISGVTASEFVTMPADLTEEEAEDWTQDSQVMQWLGEAKCLRAMVYHDLVVMFGDVPFTFIPATEREEYVFPIVDREEIQKALINDLKAAAPYMTSTSSVTVEHCSKEFAQALIARIALTAGGYSLRPNKTDARSYGTMERPANWQEFYQTARDYADSVVTSGTHKLAMDYQDVFVNECNYQLVNNDDPIFEIPFAKNSTGNIGYIQGPSYSSYEGNTVGVWGACNGGTRVNAFYRFLFRENDRRREFVNGLWYYTYKQDETGVLVDSIVIRNDYSVNNNKWSKLWTTENSALGSATTGSTGINYPYMRYADVLLMFAEADNELSDKPSDKAVDCLRQVHNRAFEDGDPDFIAAAEASKDAFRKAVLDERKWEFAGENSRWRDLVRTNNYAEELMYCFLRYYSVGMQNAQGLTGYEDYINEHDGFSIEKGYIDNLPSNVYFHKYQIDEVSLIGKRFYKAQLYGYTLDNGYNVVLKYPNQSLPSLRIYNAYASAQRPIKSYITNGGFQADDWMSATFYEWGDNNSGTPKDQCKYSFYGFMRSDDSGNIWLIRNGVQENFSNILKAEELPVVRYILPFPNIVVQRSAGAYKNYYGYNN